MSHSHIQCQPPSYWNIVLTGLLCYMRPADIVEDGTRMVCIVSECSVDAEFYMPTESVSNEWSDL